MESLATRVEALRQEVSIKLEKCLADCQAGLEAMEQAKQAVERAQHTYTEGLYAAGLLICCVNEPAGADKLVTWWALGYLLRNSEVHRQALLSAQIKMDQAKAHLLDLKEKKAQVDADVADIRARNAQLREEYLQSQERK